ncbi:MAG: hypothetical protein P8168_06000, partial [Deltaproteobacteria bacterium]
AGHLGAFANFLGLPPFRPPKYGQFYAGGFSYPRSSERFLTLELLKMNLGGLSNACIPPLTPPFKQGGNLKPR